MLPTPESLAYGPGDLGHCPSVSQMRPLDKIISEVISNCKSSFSHKPLFHFFPSPFPLPWGGPLCAAANLLLDVWPINMWQRGRRGGKRRGKGRGGEYLFEF